MPGRAAGTDGTAGKCIRCGVDISCRKVCVCFLSLLEQDTDLSQPPEPLAGLPQRSMG